MENGKTEEPKPEEKPKEARCFIDKGVLRVEVPLFMPNGEYIAYGMLHKAANVAAMFFRHIEREAAKERQMRQDILTPVGGGMGMPPRTH
jgi:hypothetical protein